MKGLPVLVDLDANDSSFPENGRDAGSKPQGRSRRPEGVSQKQNGLKSQYSRPSEPQVSS